MKSTLPRWVVGHHRYATFLHISVRPSAPGIAYVWPLQDVCGLFAYWTNTRYDTHYADAVRVLLFNIQLDKTRRPRRAWKPITKDRHAMCVLVFLYIQNVCYNRADVYFVYVYLLSDRLYFVYCELSKCSPRSSMCWMTAFRSQLISCHFGH